MKVGGRTCRSFPRPLKRIDVQADKGRKHTLLLPSPTLPLDQREDSVLDGRANYLNKILQADDNIKELLPAHIG
jgi:hypothetical protein